METAIADVSRLGFYGFETFGNVLEKWESGAACAASSTPTGYP